MHADLSVSDLDEYKPGLTVLVQYMELEPEEVLHIAKETGVQNGSGDMETTR